MCPEHPAPPPGAAPGAEPVRILRLGPCDRPAIAAHLLRMDTHDRQLRFCQVRTDEQLRAYVDGLDFTRDPVLGAARGMVLVGVCHLGIGQGADTAAAPQAELGISVDAAERGRQVGAALMNATFVAAAERGCREVHVFYLQHNHRMHGMCVRLGAGIERAGGECTARIALAPEWQGARLAAVHAGRRRIALPAGPLGLSHGVQA
jgi:GNAT superfamily N-acetyltransferase